MKKIIFLILLAIVPILQAKLPYEQKVMIYNNFIKQQPENAVFKVVEIMDEKCDNLNKFKGLSQKDTQNVLKNTFNYTKAIQMMCLSIGTIEGMNCPRETFVTAILKDDKSKNLIKGTSNSNDINGIITNAMPLHFESADVYNNNGEYFIFDGILSQRFDKDTALFQGNGGVFLLKIPKGNYTQGYRYVGIVKGTGEYKYTSLSNALQIIPKGKVLTIHLQQ